MTLRMTLSCALRFDMVPPTVSVATHTRVGGPPTSLATQLGLRKTHGCFTNMHKPKHKVLAVLFYIFSLPCAHAYNGHIFFNHSFTKWLHATSGDIDSMEHSHQTAAPQAAGFQDAAHGGADLGASEAGRRSPRARVRSPP